MNTTNHNQSNNFSKEKIAILITTFFGGLIAVLLFGALKHYSLNLLIEKGVKGFITFLLVIHIVAGIGCLSFGIGAFLTAKGGKLHRLFGKIYFYCMLIIFLTSIVITINHNNIFFFIIGFISFYPAMAGYRVLYQKRLYDGEKPKWFDYLAMVTMFIIMAYAIYIGIKNILNPQYAVGGYILVSLSITGILSLLRNFKRYRRKPLNKSFWLFVHIGEMSGSYIAACTAFLVNNSKYFPSIPNIILWLSPGIVGIILINITLKKYKNKLKLV